MVRHKMEIPEQKENLSEGTLSHLNASPQQFLLQLDKSYDYSCIVFCIPLQLFFNLWKTVFEWYMTLLNATKLDPSLFSESL